MRVIALRIKLNKLSIYMNFTTVRLKPSEFLNPMTIEIKYFSTEKVC